MPTLIYHNQNCGTSRNALAMIQASGETPRVIEYLQHPPSRERLAWLASQMDMSLRDLLRRKDTPYDKLGLDDPTLTDEQLIDAMLAHPILINRPIVVTDQGVLLCRPSERVLELMAHPVASLTKEDGEIVTYKDSA
ncbi:arsenate reductase (glutaredoxin) [Salinisphaera sp. SPP-AMP-43]|uniref:arsenate reductase (glutaredoxin) n=1 Tax=Salinisphaera sp. SPP-AMP-43 TaxID=3121288 RepID=UPI003C6EA3D8